jgi:three-Cys-motif partner protein
MAGCEATCRGKRRDGNCCDPDAADGLAVQCVGEWAEDRKHEILRKFIEATIPVRNKYLPEHGGTGGAAFVDLFAGPGRARVRETSALVDGSPLIAKKHNFTKVILCDLDPGNVDVLRTRTRGDGRVTIIPGDCNKEIDRIVAEIPAYGLNLALIDPYGIGLDFKTIEKLARASKRMDLLIHFPTGAMKRNIANAKAGVATREKMSKGVGRAVAAVAPRHVVREIETLRTNLVERLGYTGNATRIVAVKNGTGTIMYHLLYASRDPLGDDIWESITRPKVQRELFALM